MLPYKLLSFTTAVGCTVLLTLAALAVSAQNVDVTAICPGGDGSRLMKLAPADSHTMEISCEESSDTCRIKHTVTMNEEAGTTLCVTANGAPYTVTVNKAEAVQTRDSKARVENTCTRMVNATNQTPNAEAATFLNDEVRRVWAGTTGSIVTVSVCGNPERDVVVCGSGSVEAAMLGAPQLCGDAGWYQAVYTGTDSRSTNGCSGSAVRLYFTIISVPPNTNEYTIRQLSFGEPVVTSVVNLNGTQQTVTGSDASDVSVRITVDTPNPLEGYFTASQGGSNSPLIGTSRMQPDSCTGYCAFRKDSEARDWLPMSAVCAGATPNCAATTTTTCEARVQLFTESSEDITLPYQTPDGTVRYTLNGQDYVVATTQGSAVPLNGTFVFTQVAEDRVTAEGVARDLSSATTLVLQQDEQHKDVVVVRAGGEVVAASSACKFALRSVRGTDRMYSVTNVLGEPTCDLVIGNGVEQRTFHVDTPAKASGARDVENVEPLWDQVDEGGNKLALILGLSLGLGIPFVGAVAIIIGLYCCRRRETCCFAPDSECPAWLTKWSRRATDCCSGNSTDDDEKSERQGDNDRDADENDRGEENAPVPNPLQTAVAKARFHPPEVSDLMSGIYAESCSTGLDGRFRFPR